MRQVNSWMELERLTKIPANYYHREGYEPFHAEQWGVLWTEPDESGEEWRGGIKAWHKKDDEGFLTPEIEDYVNF